MRQREFETLMSPHLPVLYRMAHRFTGHAEDAEDLVQNVLAKLYPRLDEVREVDSLQPWLIKVLYREFVDSTRRGKRLLQWLQPLDDNENSGSPVREAVSTLAEPEETADRSRTVERIRQALNVLNNDQRALISLHDMEGYTMDEIAVMLGLSRGTVKSRLHRARARLRLCLNMEPFAVSDRVGTVEVNGS